MNKKEEAKFKALLKVISISYRTAIAFIKDGEYLEAIEILEDSNKSILDSLEKASNE